MAVLTIVYRSSRGLRTSKVFALRNGRLNLDNVERRIGFTNLRMKVGDGHIILTYLDRNSRLSDQIFEDGQTIEVFIPVIKQVLVAVAHALVWSVHITLAVLLHKASTEREKYGVCKLYIHAYLLYIASAVAVFKFLNAMGVRADAGS